jgi:hypothetical protein
MRLTAPPRLSWALRGLAAGAVVFLVGTPVEAQRFRPQFQPPMRPNLPGMPGNPGLGPNNPPFGPVGPNNPFGPPGQNNPFAPPVPNNPFGPPGQMPGPFGPGMGMGPPIEHVWTCSNCGRELGRGRSLLNKPSYDKCPFCGARFINGGGFGPRLMNPPSAPGGMPGQFPGRAGPVNPMPPANLGPSNSGPFQQPAQNSAWSDNSSSDSSSGDSVGKTLAIAGGVAFVSLGLIGGIVFAVVQSSGGKKRRRRRRRRYADDEDFYDDDRY